MASVNKVILIGALGRDPVTRTLPGGRVAASLSVATTEHWEDKGSGEQRDATEWHRVVCYEGTAEYCASALGKGQSVYVEGKLRTRKWTDNNGVERVITEIEAFEVKALGPRTNSDRRNPGPAQQGQNPQREAPQARGSGPTDGVGHATNQSSQQGSRRPRNYQSGGAL